MPRDKQVVGCHFGRWVVQRITRTTTGSKYVLAVCACGTRREVALGNLRQGRSKSCGCVPRRGNFKHGMRRTRIYRIWTNMMTRCYNKKAPTYKHYGARGIRVCRRWHDFTLFLLDMGLPKVGYTIERTNNNKSYTNTNCIWIPAAFQAHNKVASRKVCWSGVTLPLVVWADKLKLPRKRVQNRWGAGDRTPERLFR